MPFWGKRLADAFPIERAGADRYRVALPAHGGVSFGGDILGCATLAAARSCPDRPLHAVHACFLRPVPAEAKIPLEVEALSDGRRIARRRVSIRAGEKLLFTEVASFAAPGTGAGFQDARPPAAPDPADLPAEADVAAEEGWDDYEPGPFEWRWVGRPWNVSAPATDGSYATWIRPRVALPDDAGLRGAALAFLSDFHSHFPVARKLGGHFEPVGYASLDQLLWVHRDLHWDRWWLLHSEVDVADGGRALSRRRLFTDDGRLVASMAQEALVPGP